jgi:transposase
MPKAFPPEFRRDVIAVAHQSEAPLAQIAKDFGVSASRLKRWLTIADREGGILPARAAPGSQPSSERPANESGYLSRRTRSCAARRSIWGVMSTQNDLPAGP